MKGISKWPVKKAIRSVPADIILALRKAAQLCQVPHQLPVANPSSTPQIYGKSPLESTTESVHTPIWRPRDNRNLILRLASPQILVICPLSSRNQQQSDPNTHRELSSPISPTPTTILLANCKDPRVPQKLEAPGVESTIGPGQHTQRWANGTQVTRCSFHCHG